MDLEFLKVGDLITVITQTSLYIGELEEKNDRAIKFSEGTVLMRNSTGDHYQLKGHVEMPISDSVYISKVYPSNEALWDVYYKYKWI